jgi:hypothetical protein
MKFNNLDSIFQTVQQVLTAYTKLICN